MRAFSWTNIHLINTIHLGYVGSGFRVWIQSDPDVRKNRLTLLLVSPDFSTWSRITCYFLTPQHKDNARVVCAAGLWVKCHESRSLDRNRKLARELLTTRLDNHLNGELSVENQERMLKKLLQDKKRDETRYRRLLGSWSTVSHALSPRGLRIYWKITPQEEKKKKEKWLNDRAWALFYKIKDYSTW